MPTLQKARTIDELTDQLSRAKVAILTDYRGLKVSELQALRATLRPMGAEFRIAKNTLTTDRGRAGRDHGIDPVLEGPLALVLAFDEIVGASKAMTDFARTSRILTVKGAVLDQAESSRRADVEALATYAVARGAACEGSRAHGVADGADTCRRAQRTVPLAGVCAQGARRSARRRATRGGLGRAKLDHRNTAGHIPQRETEGGNQWTREIDRIASSR